MSTAAPSTLAIHWRVFLRRQGLLLVICLLIGLTAGALVFAARPTRYLASAHVRVATIDGDRPVIGPLTAAVEAADPSFLRRARARAGVDGALMFDGVYHTHLLAVRALAAEPSAAVKLLDTACALIVAEQNALVERMQRDAASRLAGTGEPVAVVPTLSRPAVRIGDQAVAKKASPFLGPLLAAGAGVGLVIGLLLGWWRQTSPAGDAR